MPLARKRFGVQLAERQWLPIQALTTEILTFVKHMNLNINPPKIHNSLRKRLRALGGFRRIR